MKKIDFIMKEVHSILKENERKDDHEHGIEEEAPLV